MVRSNSCYEKLEKNFRKIKKIVQSYKILDTPKLFIVRPMIKSEKISVEDQKEYPLGVGILLYLLKHMRPDIADLTMELLKVNNSVNPVHLRSYFA